MVLDTGNGRADGDGAYRKTINGANAQVGTVYVVAGSSGWVSGGTLDHPVMYIDYNEMGSFVLDIDGPTLDAKFLTASGQVTDYFTITKDSSELRFTTIRFADGEVMVVWASRMGQRYRIERAANLSGAPFDPVSGTILATGNLTSWTHRPPMGSPMGFYRAREVDE